MAEHLRQCVRCKKSFSDKRKLCPFCNMPHARPPTKTILSCPKCKVALKPEVFRKIELDVCPSCSGMWLDTLDFEQLTSEKDVYTDPRTSTHYDRLPLETPVRYRECLRCSDVMTRLNFGSISGVMIDVCADHGVWLDEHELTRLRNFIASGGIDKGQDYRLRRTNEDVSDLARRTGNLEFMQRLLHFWNWKRIVFGGKL